MDPMNRRPTRDEAIREAGAVFARIFAEADGKSPRQAADDACRGRPGQDVDRTEDLIGAERGLTPKERV